MNIKDRFGGSRRRASQRAELTQGGPVRVPVQLRRTSARGWGPWTLGVVDLGALPDGGARWSTDDPISVGFASTSGPVDEPFADIHDVYLRPVRFRTEAFWGLENDIVVAASDRGNIEVATVPGDAEAVASRLTLLLGPFRGA